MRIRYKIMEEIRKWGGSTQDRGEGWAASSAEQGSGSRTSGRKTKTRHSGIKQAGLRSPQGHQHGVTMWKNQNQVYTQSNKLVPLNSASYRDLRSITMNMSANPGPPRAGWVPEPPQVMAMCGFSRVFYPSLTTQNLPMVWTGSHIDVKDLTLGSDFFLGTSIIGICHHAWLYRKLILDLVSKN